jgi:hypothetical protein
MMPATIKKGRQRRPWSDGVQGFQRPAAARSAKPHQLCGLRSHRLRRYELRPKVQGLLRKRRALSARPLHAAPGRISFVVCVHIA